MHGCTRLIGQRRETWSRQADAVVSLPGTLNVGESCADPVTVPGCGVFVLDSAKGWNGKAHSIADVELWCIVHAARRYLDHKTETAAETFCIVETSLGTFFFCFLCGLGLFLRTSINRLVFDGITPR
jgi:hypothetical protein